MKAQLHCRQVTIYEGSKEVLLEAVAGKSPAADAANKELTEGQPYFQVRLSVDNGKAAASLFQPGSFYEFTILKVGP